MKSLIKVLSLVLLVLPFAAGASLYGNTDVTVTAGTGAAATVDADASVQGSAGTGSGSMETGTAADVTAGVNTGEVTEVDAESDATMSAEFAAFASSVKANNEDVEEVKVEGDGSINVAYRHDGKLLGFIPVKVTSHTVVKNNADGTVSATVKLPWWSFLVAGVSKVKSNIETSLQANASLQADAAVAASDEVRTRLVNAIVSSLKTEAAASATAKADASASTGY